MRHKTLSQVVAVGLSAWMLSFPARAGAQILPVVVGAAKTRFPARPEAVKPIGPPVPPRPSPGAFPTPPPPVVGPPPPPSGAPGSGIVELPGEREFNSCKKFPAGKRIVKLNLKPDTELSDLIGWISSITCRQFLIPGSIPTSGKKVTIISPQLITPEEAYRLFLASLESLQLTVEPTGRFLRIIESGKAKTTSIPVYGDGQDVPNTEGYVTRLVRVEYIDANEVATQVLARLKGEQGDVLVYAPQGTLIITDAASNIDRMLTILKELDVPGDNEKIWMLRMKNIAATEMVQKLGEIFTISQVGGRRGAAAAAPAGSAPPPKPGGGKRATTDLGSEMTISKLIPDERSNQLIVIANEKAYQRLLTMVKKLDVPLEGGDGRIHVYYCENANCDELAKTIGAITGVSVAGGGATTRSRRGASTTPTTPTPTPTGASGEKGPNLLFEGEVRISFDAPTNALIVLSSLKDYQALRKVIERLDAPRKQIFLEAVIMEVLLDKTRDLGAAFHGGKIQSFDGQNGAIVGGFDAKRTLSPSGLLGDQTALLGLSASVIGPPLAAADQILGLPAGTILPSFGVFIQALQRNNDVNVLSNPHITITNNEEGEISVGQNIPFPGAFLGGSALGQQAGFLPQVSVQRQDVALKMKVTPHVNEHNMIRMEVDQEISDIASPNFNGLGPATSKRTAKTTVVAKDQQTIVIGGLMSDRTIDRVTKIPILGDIPILGFFFRNTTKTVQKSNILIALTPYVITDQSDIRRVLEKKMKERREFIERFGADVDRSDFEAEIDYRSKRGMLEEINRASREVETEEAEMQRIRERDLQDESGPVDLPPSYKPPGGGTSPPPPAPPGVIPMSTEPR